jgi:hypothetical protein
VRYLRWKLDNEENALSALSPYLSASSNFISFSKISTAGRSAAKVSNRCDPPL